MSNDTKLWMWRGLFVAYVVVYGWIFGNLTTALISGKSTLFWGILLALISILGLPTYALYRKAKAERWQAVSHKTQTQVEVEMLAAYAKQEQTDKRQQPKPPQTPSSTGQ